MFALQLERMFKQSSSHTRRTFREPGPLLAWLGELATPAERDRLLEHFGRRYGNGEVRYRWSAATQGLVLDTDCVADASNPPPPPECSDTVLEEVGTTN